MRFTYHGGLFEGGNWAWGLNRGFMVLNNLITSSFLKSIILQQEVYTKYFQKLYQSLCDFWIKIMHFWNLSIIFSLLPKNADVTKYFGHRIFLGKFFRKFSWLPNFGASFSFLASLLTILREVSNFDPQVFPF